MDAAEPLFEAPVAGVDGCRSGWICVVAHRIEGGLDLRDVTVYGSARELIEATSGCEVVSVDMPIGFSADGLRNADFAARRFIGLRRSSVFPPPPRALLDADADYWTLNALARSIRTGLSRQTFNLLPRMRDLDAAMTPALQGRVRECHPEVSFCALKGAVLPFAKRKLDGRAERRELLAAVYGPSVRDWRAPPGAALDDLYDAAVLAWTADRIARGEAQALPAEPEYDERGLRMEIVY
jgi:predicted RNase H-like nuclease